MTISAISLKCKLNCCCAKNSEFYYMQGILTIDQHMENHSSAKDNCKDEDNGQRQWTRVSGNSNSRKNSSINGDNSTKTKPGKSGESSEGTIKSVVIEEIPLYKIYKVGRCQEIPMYMWLLSHDVQPGI